MLIFTFPQGRGVAKKKKNGRNIIFLFTKEQKGRMRLQFNIMNKSLAVWGKAQEWNIYETDDGKCIS